MFLFGGRCLALLGLILAWATTCAAEIIPPERRMQWQGNVGVPGGIPNRTKIFVNLKTTSDARFKCAGDGVTDDASRVEAALRACPAGQVVYAPAGAYRIARVVNANVTGK